MTKPDLKLVPAETAPFDEAKGRKRVEALRRQLERAAIRVVIEGKSRSPKERLLEISDISGIPRGVLELVMREGNK